MSKEEERAGSVINRRGVYYQAFGLYKEVGGFYDYGNIGLRIRRRIEGAWRSLFVDELGSLEIETTNILPEIVLKASGHASTFTDPVTRCVKCNASYRADKLLEEFYEERKDDKGMEKVRKMPKAEMDRLLQSLGIRCLKCGGSFSKIEDFNLMFKTQIGHGSENVGYLRPETAQGIFVDFKNLFRVYGLRLPALICQAGRVYRNEISPRQGLVRQREFMQMETELFFDPEAVEEALGYTEMEKVRQTDISFVKPGEKERREKVGDLLKSGSIPNSYFATMLYLEKRLLESIGIKEGLYRFRELEKEELPHYSRGNVDLEIRTSYGFIEVAGNAYRTDYDLSQHAKFSGEDVSVVSGSGKKIVPHVVEASIGIDRLFFSLLDNSVRQGGERGWDWMQLNEKSAPYRYAVFALQKDEKIVEKARGVYRLLLEKGIGAYYSDSGSIGKRYARADEIGVPFAVTCDFQTLEDDTVTVRDRDTTKQVRKSVGEIA